MTYIAFIHHEGRHVSRDIIRGFGEWICYREAPAVKGDNLINTVR